MPSLISDDLYSNTGWDEDWKEDAWMTIRRNINELFPLYRPLSHLVHYFRFHPRMKFSDPFGTDELGALAKNLARLKDSGLSDDDIKEAIDLFWLTFNRRHPNPALAFCNREFQDELLQGVRVDTGDPIMDWMMSGLEEGEDALPFDVDARGTHIKASLIGDPSVSELMFTYPDVVAEILHTWGEDSTDRLQIAGHQLEWLQQRRDDPPTDLSRLVDLIDCPKDFLSQATVRPSQPTIADAVRRLNG